MTDAAGIAITVCNEHNFIICARYEATTHAKSTVNACEISNGGCLQGRSFLRAFRKRADR
jgi:hypothetical protein